MLKPFPEPTKKSFRSTDWIFAHLNFQRIEPPGHTPGSCYILFPEGWNYDRWRHSIIKALVAGGDVRQLRQSLNTLKQLPSETHVYPGHSPNTTIEIERIINFLCNEG